MYYNHLHEAGGQQAHEGSSLGGRSQGDKKLCLRCEVDTPVVIIYRLLSGTPSGDAKVTGLLTILALAVIVHLAVVKSLAALEQICERLNLQL